MDDVPSRIEHTVLGPETDASDIGACLETAQEYNMRGCIPPWGLSVATDYAVPVATVIDFPHGQGATASVCTAAKTAWEDGADEIDLVCNIGLLTSSVDEDLRSHLSEILASVPIPVKLIVQSPRLTDDELHRIGKIGADVGAAYLKTATGFGPGGATVEDVEVLSQYLPVKASGGIGSWNEAEAMFQAGAERIGASRGATIVKEWREETESG
jgi:deoxyribose-phosphate aldolase